MESKNLKILSFILVLSLLISSLSALSTYLSSRIEGNDINETTNITTSTLVVKYKDSKYVNLIDMAPNTEITKTFTIENTSNNDLIYNLVWQDVENQNASLVIYDLTNNDNVNIASNNLPTNSEELIQESILIEANKTQEYTLKITYPQTDSPDILLVNFKGQIKAIAKTKNHHLKNN